MLPSGSFMFTALSVPRGQDGVYLVQEDRRGTVIAGHLKEYAHLYICMYVHMYTYTFVNVCFVCEGILHYMNQIN